MIEKKHDHVKGPTADEPFLTTCLKLMETSAHEPLAHHDRFVRSSALSTPPAMSRLPR